MAIRQDLKQGWQAAVDLMGKSDRGHSVLPLTQEARQFYRDLGSKGVTIDKPTIHKALPRVKGNF